ncbi:hypothetical protein H0H92_010400 [Tricholoma furcatifolium]|nr:hypothetical protein H0H92_010400 [Tricholoma furcatifolium]
MVHGVVRFLNTPLLPSSAPEDYPKVIKSGIDEEGQHYKSPKITGPDGIATLFHRIGRPQLLERLLDDTGTQAFHFRLRTGEEWLQDLYVMREGRNAEIGFIGSEGEYANPGVRYRIEHEPNSDYSIGKWVPVSTSDLGSGWSGTDTWIRAQGSAVAKAIWFQKHYNRPNFEISWSGMTPEEKEDLKAWMEERSARLNKERKELEAKHAHMDCEEEWKAVMRLYYKMRLWCRADCGEQHPKLTCSNCKFARYCSKECQLDDWKYHKTYCGSEGPIPEEFKDLL